MYIALKWLIGMVLTMWIALCSIDIYWKKSLTKQLEYDSQTLLAPFHSNTSFQLQENSNDIEIINIPNEYAHNSIHLQYLIFLVGVCMVAIFKNKNNIKVINFNFDAMNEFFRKKMCLKNPANFISVAVLKCSKILFSRLLKTNYRDINLILFNKLKELSQKRGNFGQILITGIQENKNIKRQYPLETEITNKLMASDFPERQTIENRKHNISFQQLYLVTHQENIFLKSRLKKLRKEKEDAERKLVKLINQVCQSKNNDLKAFCSQLIVHTKNNLLNSDVKAEIDKFLRKSSDVTHFQAHYQSSEQSIQHVNSDSPSIKPNEIIASENLIAVGDNAPKFRDLSREFVWTVKDKDGIIEKLYEYGSNFDNGDIVRRIRQYSVHYDAECMLDLSNSTTFINYQDADISNIRKEFMNIKLTVINRRFLSNSQEFKNFLQNNTIGTQHSRLSSSAVWLST